MSDTDSFIDEVTDEVRRDRLYAFFRRYAWFAALIIVAIVGGTAWTEYRSASQRAAAEKLGDDIIAALEFNETDKRVAALQVIDPATPGGAAVVDFTIAAGLATDGRIDEAVTALTRIVQNGDLPEIYRQIATFKSLTLQAETLPADQLRMGYQALTAAGAPLRLLAEEQLALIDITEGNRDAALARFQAILRDAEVSSDLQQRASQVIVALGGTPDTVPTSNG